MTFRFSFDYSKEDEEIYKEFNEITNTLLIETFKSEHFKNSFVSDYKEIFQDVIQYFDHLFLWEEGGKTQIFHEPWSKSFVRVITSFTNEQRVESVATLDVTMIVSSKMKAVKKALSQKTINKNALLLHLCTMVTKTTTADSIQDGSTSINKEDEGSVRRPTRKKRKIYDP